MLRYPITTLVAALLCGPLWADPPRLAAARARGTIRIDGRLLEPSWQTAFVASSFTVLGGTRPATQATAVRVLYDSRNLYFGFECQETRREALVTLIEEPDGPVYLDDCVEVFVAPGREPVPYYHFMVNAKGVLRDEAGQDEQWDSGATAAAGITADGWCAELAVPLADLAIGASAGTEWRLNLCREERPHAELSSWAPTQQGFHEPERFGWLTNLDIDIAHYAREGVVRQWKRTMSELGPALRRARAGLPLSCAQEAERHGIAAENALDEVAKLARPGANVQQLQQAEAALSKARHALAALRLVLPRVEMSLTLQRQGRPTVYAVCSESSMVRVRPDQPYSGQPAEHFSISLAANEYDATQLVVAPIEHDLQRVQVSVDTLEGPGGRSITSEQITVRRVGHVTVTQPSARSGATPGLYPDPLLPNEAVDIPRESAAAWLICVYARPGQRAGEYVGRVTVACANAPKVEFPLRVRVWGFELPTASALRTCFQLLPHYLWKYYTVPPAPGVPVGWEYGVWSGADMLGRPNFFGTGVFRSRFETARPRSGRRALCIEGEKAEPGANEVPRACYHRVFSVKPNTDYMLSVWYRTEGLPDGAAQIHIHTHAVHLTLPGAAEWTEARVTFASGDKTEARVYRCNYGVGNVYFDDISLTAVGQSGTNLVDDPSFEAGRAYEDRERLLRAYRLNSLRHRCSDMNIASPKVEVTPEGEVHIDWTEFDREIEFYLKHGLNAFNVHWARVPGGWGTVTAMDPQALAVSAEILRQTQEHLEAKGWLGLAYLYTIDEPGREAFYDVKQAFDHVHRAAPKLKRLLTLGYGASRPLRPGYPLYRALEGYVDIWVPHSDCFEPRYLETRRRAGEEIWEYVCISAQKPYANIWGIDFPGTDPRVVFWQCYAEEIVGFLYWATTYWEKDPWRDPLTYPGGNGDGSLVYPGPDGPVDSLRWETIRDGIEDYDYLKLLERLVHRAIDEKRLHELRKRAEEALNVSPVTRSFTDYSTSPATIEAHRAKVAILIERLKSELDR